MRKEKSTGWRIPLIFCAIVGVAVCIGAYFRPSAPQPDLPPELIRQAERIVIDLDASVDREWKQRIVKAGSGFVGNDEKDHRLGSLVDDALARNRYDVACTAGVLFRSPDARQKAMNRIFHAAASSCTTLPWCVFAIKGSTEDKTAYGLSLELARLWKACKP